jgi:hypothetical protein
MSDRHTFASFFYKWDYCARTQDLAYSSNFATRMYDTDRNMIGV